MADSTGFYIDVLEQDAQEVPRQIRSLESKLALINQIPPEVLALIPDSWDLRHWCQVDQDLIALTNVCQVLGGIFISRSSLWTSFGCVDTGKTRVYRERSRSSPINLWLERTSTLSPSDPFLQIIPHAIGRLRSLSVEGTLESLQEVTARLPCFTTSQPILPSDSSSTSFRVLLVSTKSDSTPQRQPPVVKWTIGITGLLEEDGNRRG